MKLWLVVYFFGEIAATVGPLPYHTPEQGETFCADFAADVLTEARAEKPGQTVTADDGRVLTHDDVSAKCEWHENRPETNPRWASP